jgi:uncharacterized protein
MNTQNFSNSVLSANDQGKKIYDSIHGFIALSSLEFKLIQHPYFERLRYIHQLGAALFVYPGARISRYEHSLGVMHTASKIFDSLIYRLESEQGLVAFGLESTEDKEYYRAVLRTAALVHDIGHLPFSHVGELAFAKGDEKLHENIGKQLLLSEHFESFFAEGITHYRESFKEDVIAVAFGEAKAQNSWLSFVSKIIPSDYFGADRIDYLLRDTHATGLSQRFDSDQLIDKLTLIQKDASALDIAILQSGLESIEGLLVCRYFVHRSLYYHEGVRTFSMHLANVMRDSFDLPDLDGLLTFTDTAVLAQIEKEPKSSHHTLALRAPYAQRFVALEIEPLTEDQKLLDLELKEIAQSLNIPKGCIDLTYGTRLSKPSVQETLNLKKSSGAVISASEASQLLQEKERIFKGKKYWIFVQRDYSGRLQKNAAITFSIIA